MKVFGFVWRLAPAFGALLFTTLQDDLQYYKYVDEVAASPSEWEGNCEVSVQV